MLIYMHFAIDGSTFAERHNLSANSMEQFSYMQPIRVCTPFVRVLSFVFQCRCGSDSVNIAAIRCVLRLTEDECGNARTWK